MARPSLHVVPGTPAPDSPAERAYKRIRAMPKPAEMIQCPRCGGRETIETKIGVEYVDGKTRGGTKSLICASCYMKGERVVIA